jgi:small conductance mechanosensitive channel
VQIIVRPWVQASDYWNVRFDLIEKIKQSFDENGISFPFPQRDVHIHQMNQQSSTER